MSIYYNRDNLNLFFPLFSLLRFTDHSVHAPSTTNDPWTIEFPDNAGYEIKAVDGVFNLFRDTECTDNVNFQYLNLEDFVQDMNSICAMMADGPL